MDKEFFTRAKVKEPQEFNVRFLQIPLPIFLEKAVFPVEEIEIPELQILVSRVCIGKR